MKFFTTARIIVAATLLGALLLGLYVYNKETPSKYETTLVKRGDVVQEVSMTGRVSSEKEVNLAFESGGRVTAEPRRVGARVNTGDVLVQLDTNELQTLLAQAKANLNYENAKLAELKRGARAEDILVSQVKVESAKGALADAQQSVFDKLHSAYTTSDDVIHNVVDQFYKNPRTNSPQLVFVANDAKLTIELESSRLAIETMLSTWGTDVNEWEGGTPALVALAASDANLAQIKTFLERLAFAVNGLAAGTSPTQATLDSWKLAVSSARSNINTTITASLAASEKYRAAGRALEIAQEELTLKQVGPTFEAISAQEAKIEGVAATLENYSAQITKKTLRAPIKGVVTEQDAKLGQTVTPNVPIVTLMSDGLYKIEANIPEVDVAKVKVGDVARVTLDAYGAEVVFVSKVAMIDPAETIIEGVSTYKVTLRFVENDARVRSGMTANIDISTATKEGVLMLPARAVTGRNGTKNVRVLSVVDQKEVIEERAVITGLRGSDGNVEIISGVEEGERVVTFETKAQ
jgi:RND family efflux transporter MFP subunit